MPIEQDGISTKQARASFTEILSRAQYGKERVRITRRGKTVAFIVPAIDVALLEEMEDREDREAIAEAKAEIAAGLAEPWDVVKDRMG